MKKLHPAVKAVIKKNNKFLVIKQKFLDKIVWDLPGGLVDFGEDPYNALIREVKEEVNLSIKIVRPIGLFWFFRYDGDQVICNTFLCKASRYDVDMTKALHEKNIVKQIEYSWVTKDEFLSSNYKVGHDSMKKLIEVL
ncbi:MAG: NUDIX hydrolase [uncultured bacterium]|nr:MAG: NUDIX hydrolase [uncultured bacterium]HCU70597.1 hypothetical protein [Candidatus Moranbacteria bacterium]